MNANKNWFVKNEDGTITFTFPMIDDAYNQMLITMVGALYDSVKKQYAEDKENNRFLKKENTVSYFENNTSWLDDIENAVSINAEYANEWEIE